jgi:DNA-binding transcriptional ArsR family regulator
MTPTRSTGAEDDGEFEYSGTMANTLPPGSKNPEPDVSAIRSNVLPVLQALADPVRLEMVHRLRTAGQDQGCGALYDELPKSTASYHFRILRESGLIDQYDRNGRRINHLRENEIERVAPGLLNAVFG